MNSLRRCWRHSRKTWAEHLHYQDERGAGWLSRLLAWYVIPIAPLTYWLDDLKDPAVPWAQAEYRRACQEDQEAARAHEGPPWVLQNSQALWAPVLARVPDWRKVNKVPPAWVYRWSTPVAGLVAFVWALPLLVGALRLLWSAWLGAAWLTGRAMGWIP